MNQLFPFVEEAFRSTSPQAVPRLLDQLARLPGEKSEQLGLPLNWEYVLKRLLGALLAREPTLKFNAFLALSALAPHLSAVRTEALFEYFAALSNFKKHCEGKPSEIEAYVIGKILAFKALRSLFAGNLNSIAHLAALMTDFPAYEEQIVQLVSQLATDKKSKAAFQKLSPSTKAGFVLHTLLAAQLKDAVAELNQNVVIDVLSELQSLYPKRSICLDYLAPHLKSFLEAPADFLSEQLAALFEGEQLNVRKLFYLLQVVQGHLKGVTITGENVWKLLSVQVLGGWILQLKVKNKHIRRMAEAITIDFQPDPELSFTLLSKLHEKQLYLENINHKHPLYSLYLHVEPHHYSQYLLGLIAQAGSQEEQKISHYNELEVFLVARHKELTVEQVCQIVTVFVNKYQEKNEEGALQALNTIFNALLPSNPKKTQVLHTRASLILAKLPLEQVELGEQQADVKQAIRQIRSRFKESKEEKDPFNIAFLNFLLSAGFYCLIFPQEVEVFADLEVVEKELRANVLFSEAAVQGKKKRKGEGDRNKPVHVLVEIFISLLTKSSQFLRTPINILFEHIVPFIDASDIATLLEVITKPESELLNAEE